MSSSRRDFLSLAAVSWLSTKAGSLVDLVAPQTASLRWHRVGVDAWVVQNGGGNTTVLVDQGRAIVVDVKVAGVGRVLAGEIAARIGPVESVLLTHHHYDHAGGLHGFAGRPIIAQANASARIRTDTIASIASAKADPKAAAQGILKSLAADFEYPTTPTSSKVVERFISWLPDADPDQLLPTRAVENRESTLLAKSTLDLAHIGPGHTDNDLFMFDPRRDLLATGDLLFDRHHPYIDVGAGASTTGWQRSIAAMLKIAGPKTRIVSGHGRVVDRSGLTDQSNYFDQLRDLVAKKRAAGQTREDVTKTPVAQFAAGFHFGDLWSQNLGVLFDELADGS